MAAFAHVKFIGFICIENNSRKSVDTWTNHLKVMCVYRAAQISKPLYQMIKSRITSF